MSEKLECKRCAEVFEATEAPIGKCPNCNGTLNYLAKPESRKKSAKSTRDSEDSEVTRASRSWNAEAKVGNTSWNPDLVKQRIRNDSGTPKSFGDKSSKESTLDDLVNAQNKTTYAVRSLAIFFFISLQTGLVGGGIFGLAVNNQSHYDSYGYLNGGATFWAALGAFIALAGFAVAITAGRQELNKSKP